MLIDIIKDNTDPYARYTMPKLLLTIEGKASNTRTILTNLSSISLSLKRPSSLLLKYIGYERGTKTEIKHNKHSLRGNFTDYDIQDLIYKFIKELVLCAECKNPETYYIIEKDKCLYMKCYACGAKSKVCKGRKVYNIIERDIIDIGNNENNGNNANKNYVSRNEEERGNVEDLGEDECNIFLLASNVDDVSGLDQFSGIESGDVKKLLGGLENNVVEKDRIDMMVEYVKYLIEFKIVKKIDCFKYFQVKSKYVSKESSQKIRVVMTHFFKQ